MSSPTKRRKSSIEIKEYKNTQQETSLSSAHKYHNKSQNYKSYHSQYESPLLVGSNHVLMTKKKTMGKESVGTPAKSYVLGSDY